MLGKKKMALRVRHQAEDASGFIADAGDIINRAVGIFRIRCRAAFLGCVTKNNLIIFFQTFQNGIVFGDKLSLAVSNG